MADTVLFDNGVHPNILLEDSGGVGLAVQANQHLIVHNGEAMLLDPGGHKVYSKVMAKTFSALGRRQTCATCSFRTRTRTSSPPSMAG